MKLDRASIVRMATAVLAAAKLVLNMFGVEIPQEITDGLVDIVAAVWLIITSWKNNYVSSKGIRQKDVLQKNNLA
jgi:SPP1 family holin